MLAMDVARDDQELLVVTENGYGKRTPISEYPVKGRGTMGVKTIQLTENKGALAGALVVREHQELVFISQNGMVQRTSVRGINRYGRASQGVRVMNIRDDDQVSRRRAGGGIRGRDGGSGHRRLGRSARARVPRRCGLRLRVGRVTPSARRAIARPVPHRVRLRSCAMLARVRPSGAGRGRDARPARRRMTRSGGGRGGPHQDPKTSPVFDNLLSTRERRWSELV